MLDESSTCSDFVLMPEKRPSRLDKPLLLSDAVRNRSLIRAKCAGCSPASWYDPQDLIALYSDMPIANLDRVMRCQSCGAFLNVKVTTPTAKERQGIRLRRLDRIWWVRRVRWREE